MVKCPDNAKTAATRLNMVQLKGSYIGRYVESPVAFWDNRKTVVDDNYNDLFIPGKIVSAYGS